MNWGHGLKLHLAISSAQRCQEGDKTRFARARLPASPFFLVRVTYVVSQMGVCAGDPQPPPTSFFPKSKCVPPRGGTRFSPKSGGGRRPPPLPLEKTLLFPQGTEQRGAIHLRNPQLSFFPLFCGFRFFPPSSITRPEERFC